MWNADTYDDYYKTFEGAVDHFVDWALLQKHLPEDKDIRILDAAGGTGRISLLLAQAGYKVTLCDITPDMLRVAKQKMQNEGVADLVNIVECDVTDLQFADATFDLVICWDGGFDAIDEITRVTKTGGIISVFLISKWNKIVNEFHNNPKAALELLNKEKSVIEDRYGKYLVIDSNECNTLFRNHGFEVKNIYGVCGLLEILDIPRENLKSCQWDDVFFKQTTELVLELSRRPGIKEMARHLVVYGVKK